MKTMSETKNSTEHTIDSRIDSSNDASIGRFMGRKQKKNHHHQHHKNLNGDDNDNNNNNNNNDKEQEKETSTSSTKMSKEYALKAAKYAIKHFRKFVRSDAFQILQENVGAKRVAQIEHSELELGEVIGKGGFSRIFAIKKSLSNNISKDQYVVKTLRKMILEKPTRFANGVLGLAKEGAILGLLDHPHIIKLRGTSIDDLWRISNGRHDSYFLILDKLELTLHDQLLQWRKQSLKDKLNMLLPRRQKKIKKEQFIERYQFGIQIADAVSYLHTHNILHRDLKPDNIGFDHNGTIKLFDLNISRLLPKSNYQDETFKLTKTTGTPRYMCPECGLGKTYNLKADVYSFTLVLYEILSLKIPFDGLSGQEHIENVWKKGCERPSIPNSWPLPLKRLIEKSWSHNHRKRPSMIDIYHTLVDQHSETTESSDIVNTNTDETNFLVSTTETATTPTAIADQPIAA